LYTLRNTSDEDSTSDEDVQRKPKANKAPRKDDDNSSNTTTEPHEQIIDTFLPPSKYAEYTPVQKKTYAKKPPPKATEVIDLDSDVELAIPTPDAKIMEEDATNSKQSTPTNRQRHVTITTPTETPPAMNSIAETAAPPSVHGEPRQIDIKR
jgi:hypothetical protein